MTESLCGDGDGHSMVFTPPGSPLLLRSAMASSCENAARNRSPSLPIASTQLPPNINRSRSPSLGVAHANVVASVVSEKGVNGTRSERCSRSDVFLNNREANRSNTAYSNRSDSGISTCSHSSLLDSFSKPWLIHEEEENDEKLNPFAIGCSSGGATLAEKS